MNPAILGSIAALCWGIHDLAAGISSRRIGPVATVFSVTLAGLIALTVWLGLFGSFPSVVRADVWLPAAAGVGYAAATFGLFAAFANGPFSLAAPIGGSYPLTSLLIAAASGTPTSVAQLIAAVTVIGGVIVVATAKSDLAGDATSTGHNIPRALMFACLAHVSFAGAIATGQHAATAFGSIEATWISRIAGLAILTGLVWSRPVAGRLDAKWIGLLAVIGTLDAIAICLLNSAGHGEQPQIAAVAGSAFGAITIVLARVILKEAIPPRRWIGIVVTFAGVAALTALS